MPNVLERLGNSVLFRRIVHVETRILHVERIKQTLFLESVERFSGDDLDQAAENVGRVAVVPGGPGLEHQRQLGKAIGEFRVVEIAFGQAGVVVSLFHQQVSEIAVG